MLGGVKMVGTNYCPLNGVKDTNKFIKKKLEELGIEVSDERSSRISYCIRCCPARVC